MLSVFLITIGSLLIGYGLGRMHSEKKSFKEYIDNQIKAVDEKIHPVHLGSVTRPTAQRLDRIRDPKKYEEEQEMIKALQKVKDLN